MESPQTDTKKARFNSACEGLSRSNGVVRPEDLVAWDAKHGRSLFQWDDLIAANNWRCHEARMMMSWFVQDGSKYRMRLWANVQPTDEADLAGRGYVALPDVLRQPSLKSQLIAATKSRFEAGLRELNFLKLPASEARQLFDEAFSEVYGVTGDGRQARASDDRGVRVRERQKDSPRGVQAAHR